MIATGNREPHVLAQAQPEASAASSAHRNQAIVYGAALLAFVGIAFGIKQVVEEGNGLQGQNVPAGVYVEAIGINPMGQAQVDLVSESREALKGVDCGLIDGLPLSPSETWGSGTHNGISCAVDAGQTAAEPKVTLAELQKFIPN